MSHKSFAPKLVSLSAEARTRSAMDMWRLRADQSLVPRLGKSALGVALKSEFLRNKVLGSVAGRYGDNEVISNGSEQIVMQDGPDRVIKLLVGSLSLAKADVEKTVKEMQERSDTAASFLEDAWVPTKFEVAELKSGKPIVVAKQPFVNNVNYYHSAIEVPLGAESRRLGVAMASLQDQTGLYPDILGVNNIAASRSDGGLKVVDTIVGHRSELGFVPLGEDRTVEQITDYHLNRWLA